MTWIILIVVIIMLFSALATMFLPNMLAAVAASSVVSLAVAVVFVFLQAPDVAMTEAAIGAGLSSLLLALGLRRLGLWHLDPGDFLLREEPSADNQEPSADNQEPSADKEPSAGKEPSADKQEPSAGKEPSAAIEPPREGSNA